MTGSTTMVDKMFSGGSRVNVKDPSDRYSTKRWEAKHPKYGEVFNPSTDRPCEQPSQLDNAKAGCYIKREAQRAGNVLR